MEVKITFSAEVYIKGEDLEEIKSKWKSMELLNNAIVADNDADFVELVSVERIDDDSYADIKKELM